MNLAAWPANKSVSKCKQADPVTEKLKSAPIGGWAGGDWLKPRGEWPWDVRKATLVGPVLEAGRKMKIRNKLN